MPAFKLHQRRFLTFVDWQFLFVFLQARGPKKHLKRVAAPKHWMLDKLTGVFVSTLKYLNIATVWLQISFSFFWVCYVCFGWHTMRAWNVFYYSCESFSVVSHLTALRGLDVSRFIVCICFLSVFRNWSFDFVSNLSSKIFAGLNSQLICTLANLKLSMTSPPLLFLFVYLL